MYTVVKTLSENTLLAEKNNEIFVLKRISETDVPLFRKLFGINQPGLSRVFEITVLEDGIYAVSEFISGLPLKDYIGQKGVMDEKTATDFAIMLCDALAGLHSLGIVHRDLTPNNIIVTGNNLPVIIDYGISRIGKGNKTSDTDTLGTAGYAAPEQFGFRETDSRTDIYALGAVIRFCMTGNPCGRIAGSKQIGRIAEKCSAYEASDRYGSAKQVKEELSHKKCDFEIPAQKKGRKRFAQISTAIYILFMAIYLYCYSPLFSPVNEYTSIVLMLVAAPVFCLNPLYWQDRLPFNLPFSRKTRRFFFTVLGTVCLIVGHNLLGKVIDGNLS